ncbi:MAG: hypothetical protein AAFX85_04840 [Pseudomonadota bacterium]
MTTSLPQLTVGISVTSSPEARAMGFDESALHRLLVRIAEHFIATGQRVLFGHDWRYDGVMRAIGAYAQIAVSSGSLNGEEHQERLLNIVPTAGKGLPPSAAEAEGYSAGALKVSALEDVVDQAMVNGKSLELPADWQQDRIAELWVLRAYLTQLLDPGCRICLGGKTHDYQGYYGGLAEEAFFGMKAGKPVYLLPAFGGTTRVVWDALDGQRTDHEVLRPAKSPPKPNSLRSKVATQCGLPQRGLGKALAKIGRGGYCALNGLSSTDCNALAKTTDIEVALEIITRSLRKVTAR